MRLSEAIQTKRLQEISPHDMIGFDAALRLGRPLLDMVDAAHRPSRWRLRLVKIPGAALQW